MLTEEDKITIREIVSEELKKAKEEVEPTWKRILRKRLDEGAITQEWFDYLLSRIDGNCYVPMCGGLEQWECCGLRMYGTDICPICKAEMPVSEVKVTWKRAED